ncbi:molybdopterin oxidoreductase [Thermodesulfatator indicus DSM 15286]|uniref:Periplasmic nitrate reductase n=1 Tax=Thermodesulfatator indicus (strain DSM 15286 / JCM 11887 / CIR29812) TaxID=667014 RepID=F8AE26_THEID|nr:nitrate reductase [Thermodesulfatator indicus]AEH46072.1 molybdopterin oxidoreductase [Thermodesulfatator indicus DSM 15286]
MALTRREFLKRTAALTAASLVGMKLPFVLDQEAQAADADKWVRGVCRFCGVGCRVELGLKNGKPVAIRGVPQSRTNFGFLCMKGMLFYQIMNHPERLKKPLYRASKKEKFREISWEEALDIAAEKFAQAVKNYGPNSVAYYGSGQALTEETYLFQKVMRAGLRTNNVEGNPRLCMASAVGGYLTSFGADEPIGSYADIEQAFCFFIIGSNMAEAHPVLFRRVMRRKLDNPQKVFVINADPRVSPTSRIADIHLQFKPGTDLALLNAMAYVIVEEKLYDENFIKNYCVFRVGKNKKKVSFEEYKKFLAAYTPERAAEICGGNITPEIIRLVARKFATSPATMSFWTMGLNQRIRGVWANNLVHNLHLLTGQLCRPGADSFSLTGQPNACGGVREGGGLCHILPGHRPVKVDKLRHQVEDLWGVPRGRIPAKPGYHTIAMFKAVNEGKIKAIWINCTSPAQSLPDVDKYRKGMAREDVFMVVTDIFPTKTTELANLVLPTAFHFEKTGVYGCTERRSQITVKTIDPPGEAKPEVWIVREWALKLAEKLNDPVIKKTVEPFIGLEEGFALPKAIWDEYTQKLTAGRDNDLRGATYEVLMQRPDGVQWPAPTKEWALKGGTYKKFVRGLDPLADEHAVDEKPYQFYGPAHKDHKLWIWLRPYKGAAEEPDAEYPFYLSTGRIIDHWHTTSMTGRIKELLRANPYAFVEINPKDAKRLGINPGDMVLVETRRGRNILPAKVYEGPMEGMVFVYWHDMYEERMINRVTKDAFDPGSKEPEFKICACRIKRISGPKPLKPYVVGHKM